MEIYNKLATKKTRKYLRKNSTQAENILWQALRGKKVINTKFKRQYSVDRYVLDFYCPEFKLVIELDGEVHNDKYVSDNDRVRTEFLNSFNMKVLRFKNEEIFNSLEIVLNKIKSEILKMRI
jgi:very-short-patch-repair endonuclease